MPSDPSRLIAALARDRINLDLKTLDVCIHEKTRMMRAFGMFRDTTGHSIGGGGDNHIEL